MKVVTMGEIMLRLSTPGNSRFVQTDTFDACYGGGEANVAVSLANYGHEAYFVSKVPAHEIGQCAINALRRYGVHTEYVARGGDRLGIYYLETGAVTAGSIKKAFCECSVYPVLFGSGLKTDGVDLLLETVASFAPLKEYGEEFSARVYKVTHDDRNQRVTHLKITGGSLRVRSTVAYKDSEGNLLEEKISGIRTYTGDRFTLSETAVAGEVVGITGLSGTFAGQGLGAAGGDSNPLSEPVFSYTIVPEDDVDILWLYKQIRPYGGKIADIFLLTVDDAARVYCARKEGKR